MHVLFQEKRSSVFSHVVTSVKRSIGFMHFDSGFAKLDLPCRCLFCFGLSDCVDCVCVFFFKVVCKRKQGRLFIVNRYQHSGLRTSWSIEIETDLRRLPT